MWSDDPTGEYGRRLDLILFSPRPAGPEVWPCPEGLTDEERRILEGLGHGRVAAISVADLARVTDLHPRRCQAIVEHLIKRHQAPIGTSTRPPFGYYLITTDRERREVRDGLVRRAIRVLARARAYDRSGWVQQVIGQGELVLRHGNEP